MSGHLGNLWKVIIIDTYYITIIIIIISYIYYNNYEKSPFKRQARGSTPIIIITMIIIRAEPLSCRLKGDFHICFYDTTFRVYYLNVLHFPNNNYAGAMLEMICTVPLSNIIGCQTRSYPTFTRLLRSTSVNDNDTIILFENTTCLC